MLVAIIAKLIGRWAHDENTISVGMIVGAIFVVVVVGMMDSGATEEIAKGIAWLILASVLLANDSILPALGKLITNTEAVNQ